jgi:hypothetical protein
MQTKCHDTAPVRQCYGKDSLFGKSRETSLKHVNNMSLATRLAPGKQENTFFEVLFCGSDRQLPDARTAKGAESTDAFPVKRIPGLPMKTAEYRKQESGEIGPESGMCFAMQRYGSNDRREPASRRKLCSGWYQLQ